MCFIHSHMAAVSRASRGRKRVCRKRSSKYSQMMEDSISGSPSSSSVGTPPSRFSFKYSDVRFSLPGKSTCRASHGREIDDHATSRTNHYFRPKHLGLGLLFEFSNLSARQYRITEPREKIIGARHIADEMLIGEGAVLARVAQN